MWGRLWVSIETSVPSPCFPRFEQLLVQIYIYLHVISIEAGPGLIWATVPGPWTGSLRFSLLDGLEGCACVSGFKNYVFLKIHFMFLLLILT